MSGERVGVVPRPGTVAKAGDTFVVVPEGPATVADFSAYAEAQRQVSEAFVDRKRWTAMAIRNVARSGFFSSDRTIRQYAEEIWESSSVPIDYVSRSNL